MQGFTHGRCACQKNHAVENHVRRGISVFLFLVAAATTDCKTAVVIAHLPEFSPIFSLLT